MEVWILKIFTRLVDSDGWEIIGYYTSQDKAYCKLQELFQNPNRKDDIKEYLIYKIKVE